MAIYLHIANSMAPAANHNMQGKQLKTKLIHAGVALLAITGAVLLCGAGRIFKCTDENGEIFYTQTLDRAKCAAGGAILNEQGMPVSIIERRKTPEEIAQEKLKAQAVLEQQRLAQEQRKQDNILLTFYPTEGALKKEHEKAIATVDLEISGIKLQLENQQRSLENLLAAAAEAERLRQAVSASVTRDLKTVRQQIEEQNKYLQSKEAEKKAVDLSFNKKLIRYRELKSLQRDR